MHQTELEFAAVPSTRSPDVEVSSAVDRLASLVAFIMEIPLVVAGGGIEAQYDRLVAEARALRGAIDSRIAAEHAHRMESTSSATQVIAARCTRLQEDAALAHISWRLEHVVGQHARDYVLRSLVLRGLPEQPPATAECVNAH